MLSDSTFLDNSSVPGSSDITGFPAGISTMALRGEDAVSGNGGNGGFASVTTNSPLTLTEFIVSSGERGQSPASNTPGNGGEATLAATSTSVDAESIVIGNAKFISYGDPGYRYAAGGITFEVGTLISRPGYTFTIGAEPSNPLISIGEYAFDLEGVSADDTVLALTGGTLEVAYDTVALTGTPGTLPVGDVITLFSGTAGGSTYIASTLSTGGYDFEVSIAAGDLVATVTAVPAPPPPTDYTVLEDFGTWSGSGGAASRIDADLAKFVELTLSGATVLAANYEVTAGSTVVTLKESYLKTLVNGDYVFTAEFTDGIASDIDLKVDVAAAPDPGGTPGTGGNPATGPNAGNGAGVGNSPRTGDGSGSALLLVCALLALSLCLPLRGEVKARRGTAR